MLSHGRAACLIAASHYQSLYSFMHGYRAEVRLPPVLCQGDINRYGNMRGTIASVLKRQNHGLQAVDNRMDIHRDELCVNEKFFQAIFFVQKPSHPHTTLTQRLSVRQAIVYKDKSGLIHRKRRR